MTDLSPTLASLLRVGFERRPDAFGMATVGYSFPVLDLTASDRINRLFIPVVLLGGVLNTGRVLAEIQSELPPTLETPEIAAAWVSYALSSHRRELEPLPAWMTDGERNWDAIPFVRRRREYKARPRCSLDREHARLLRRSLIEALSCLPGKSAMTFSFDGRVLSVRLDGRSFDALATGPAWPNAYRIAAARDTKLPVRFSSPQVEVSFFDGALQFDRVRFPGAEVAR